MRKFGLVIGAGALAALAGCSDRTVNSSNGSITINTTAIGGDLQNGAEAAGNMARNGARVVGNELGRAGQVIGNNARAAWNEIRETAREVGGGNDEGNASGNSSAK